jgi:catechol 2,3-dioxygenase-like lactoylglutathione lyase family enzyme
MRDHGRRRCLFVLVGLLLAAMGCGGVRSIAALPDSASGDGQPPGFRTSHLFMGVRDTDATIAFWRDGLDGVLESDDVLEDDALDLMMGRENVRIRHTFLSVADTRLHTVEYLDVPAPEASQAPRRGAIGIGGVSFIVPDLDAAHAATQEKGLRPTPIFVFGYNDPPTRMFFLEDPDGIRVELIEAP